MAPPQLLFGNLTNIPTQQTQLQFPTVQPEQSFWSNLKDRVTPIFTKNYNTIRSFNDAYKSTGSVSQAIKAAGQQTIGDWFKILGLFNVIDPPTVYRAAVDKMNGSTWNQFGNSVLNGNSGFYTPEYAAANPKEAFLGNFAGSLILSNPKGVLNLGKAGLRYLDDIARNITPPAAPAVAVSTNGATSVLSDGITLTNPNVPNLESLNGVSLIPAANRTGQNYYDALGKQQPNPEYKDYSKDLRYQDPTHPSSYPYIQKISPEEQNFLFNQFGRFDFFDILPKLNTEYVFSGPVHGQKNYGRVVRQITPDDEMLEAVGNISKEPATFGDYLYRISRILDNNNFPPQNPKLFSILNITGKDKSNIKNARAVIADMRGQLFSEKYLTPDILQGKEKLNLIADDIEDYLNAVHHGHYADVPESSVEGFIKVQYGKNTNGAPHYRFEWDPNISEEQKQAIINNFENAIVNGFKNGGKLLPRRFGD